jgi:hypothetical protein
MASVNRGDLSGVVNLARAFSTCPWLKADELREDVVQRGPRRLTGDPTHPESSSVVFGGSGDGCGCVSAGQVKLIKKTIGETALSIDRSSFGHKVTVELLGIRKSLLGHQSSPPAVAANS